MKLFDIQKYNLNNVYHLTVQVDMNAITNSFNTLMAIYFYRSFKKAVITNFNEFKNNTHPTIDFYLSERHISGNFTISTLDKKFHESCLIVLEELKKTDDDMLQQIKGLYTKDGSKMADYLTKYISQHFLREALAQCSEDKKETLKKAKI